MPSVSVIVPTCGRDTLPRTLASVGSQLHDGDEMLVVRRDDAPWGNATREDSIPRCDGTHIWFMDDDDVAAPGALDAIHAAIGKEPDRVHLFRMRRGEDVFWRMPVAEIGNVGSPMIVVPNTPGKLPRWGDDDLYEADGRFLLETLALRQEQPVFHEEIVALVRPE